MYVITYETSSLQNLSFLQHALFHHVCCRSFCFIFTELERLCKQAIIEASSRSVRFLAFFLFAFFRGADGENKATKKRFKNCLKMSCRLQQPVRERSTGAFPEKWLAIEPK